MDRSQTVTAISAALVEVVHHELPDLTEDTRLFEDLQLDSTGILELLMALEENVGIEVDPDSLGMENFNTVRSLADYIQANHDVPAEDVPAHTVPAHNVTV
jgi:acyl carrier protein